MQLTIELVPKTSWGHNVRTLVPRKTWDVIRHKCYEAAGNVCEICGGQGSRHKVECHEIWHYDDDTLTQTLRGFVALCPMCHRVKHIMRTINVGLGRTAFLHMARVNDWTMEEATEYFLNAVETWEERSKYPWKVDISYIDEYVKER